MKLLIINTGGTFNKIYNPISGELEVPKNNIAVESILENCGENIDYKIVGTIFKDSLDLVEEDREKISKILSETSCKNIVIIHGTDTMDITAKYLADIFPNKKIILVGAMKPISINPFDGILNFGLALGYLQGKPENGIYISMSGLLLEYTKILKDRKIGEFVQS